jgi:hypothetical protein
MMDPTRIEMANELSQYLIPILQKTLKKALEDATKCCINCVMFDEPNVMCKEFKMTPPPKVIAMGCPSFMDNEDVPF